ncbi:MAG: GNAT family N-acetyltransferase [Clostridia bacterium]|nr:GNAT family N-acetyltransferase [Clostridia bacterium]
MDLSIRALTPELVGDYLDFFDHRAFSDGSPYYPCYCNAFNLSTEGIRAMIAPAEARGGGKEAVRDTLRESARQMVLDGRIRGYLAYDGGLSVGWCNANDRMNYFRVGEFNTDDVPEDRPPEDCPSPGFIRSIVCFEISPAYRGMGIAGMLLARVCEDAAAQGYSFVEAYPQDQVEDISLAFTGPRRLYEKAGFTQFGRRGSAVIMRKALI